MKIYTNKYLDTYISKMSSQIDQYISKYPKNTQTILIKIKETIQNLAPSAEQTISYAIPTFDLNGKHMVHFAAFQNHIWFFPTPWAIIKFKKELSWYKTSKWTIQFPLDKPIPFDLIQKITKFRIKEITII